ncbi:DUF368 domain-containing protein [Halomonas sp. McH1-25]|uniref:DUF368 domain-containing protein n=1 Tax=unclassified Halomonas TaxID=2609666 RepID=UPI001EF71FA6|nr:MULTISPECIES: DUF368 domain-containing protein [unclassified Halomonas]MCG7600499.1 DUF368 domain-containing protein [Halomonas sp. McH1-25]MCP1343559.1 DUF368 domain-containing protein [Halomonas sp. FL8]MCP1360006.1 DUF368 domain-containing protein [Halomonas sp. BBD45]
MKRALALFLKGAGMGAADAVPGVSGGTIAFVTGIYEELIHTIRRFGPEAFPAWRQGGLAGLVEYLNLRFLIPLVVGLACSLISVAHLVTYLLEAQPLLLDAFFFGLVAASAFVVGRQVKGWRWWYILPLVAGLLLAQALPGLMPHLTGLGSWLLIVAGAIAISAMLLPGVSGSFLLLTMGLYGTVMEGIKSFDIGLILQFGAGCAIGLFTFSRLLSWLFRHYHELTLQLLIGFIVGSLPTLWPWREMIRYRLGPDDQLIPLDYRYLLPDDYVLLTGDSAQLVPVIALMALGMLLVLVVGERSTSNRKED